MNSDRSLVKAHPWSKRRARLKADLERWERIKAGKQALREYIAAIGGELRVSVVFPDETIDLGGGELFLLGCRR